jgi:NitT/TauT family transport system ATP-binding protein
MTPPLVEFRQVGKRFGDGPPVLDNIRLTAEAGEFISVIGPSGCGKSTLLRLLAGLSPVTTGALFIAGQPPDQAGAELAFVFQEPALLPWHTVTKNVELPLRLRGVPATERAPAATAALALVGLADRGGFYPRQLSGGQKMRVSLARALTLAPKLLLLDEPFGALDELTRQGLNEELLAIHLRQAWTAFFVTHSVAEAVFLSRRVVVLSAHPGRIQAEIAVPLAYPRTSETRLSRDYQDLVVEVSRQLAETSPKNNGSPSRPRLPATQNHRTDPS